MCYALSSPLLGGERYCQPRVKPQRGLRFAMCCPLPCHVHHSPGDWALLRVPRAVRTVQYSTVQHQRSPPANCWRLLPVYISVRPPFDSIDAAHFCQCLCHVCLSHRVDLRLILQSCLEPVNPLSPARSILESKALTEGSKSLCDSRTDKKRVGVWRQTGGAYFCPRVLAFIFGAGEKSHCSMLSRPAMTLSFN